MPRGAQGRKKKPFIDKRKAHTYKLVTRSQQDPLYGDCEEPQNVLHSDEVTMDGAAQGV